jgi:hypothetical protein
MKDLPFNIERDWIDNLLIRAAELGANRALENAGVIKDIIKLSEVKKKYGRGIASEARIAPGINWVPIGRGGKSSGAYCKRSELDKFLLHREFDFHKK